ncbi:MAG: bacillithiol system redox-active protein YtxJ [Nonlabens sp.]
MGIIDKFFKSQRDIAKEEIKGLDWDQLDSIDQLDNLIANSSKRPKVIFKHSTRCGISRMALGQFEKNYESDGVDAGYYLLDLLRNRDVSDAVASKLAVQHQSPQVIVISNGEVIHTDSHHGIDIKKIQELIKKN